MTAPKTKLIAMVESVTCKMDKEGGIKSKLKMSSLDSPGRLAALSGKALSLNSQTGTQKTAVRCVAVANKIDATGDHPRIKTALTCGGDAGLEKLLGHTVVLETLQGELPGMEEEDGEER
jgi:hypothetical protein